MWTQEEDKVIIQMYREDGPRWSVIAKKLVGRPENMIKNRFYSFLKKHFLECLNNEDIDIDEYIKEHNFTYS